MLQNRCVSMVFLYIVNRNDIFDRRTIILINFPGTLYHQDILDWTLYCAKLKLYKILNLILSSHCFGFELIFQTDL